MDSIRLVITRVTSYLVQDFEILVYILNRVETNWLQNWIHDMWYMVIFVSNFAKNCTQIKKQRFVKLLYIMLLFIYYIAPT